MSKYYNSNNSNSSKIVAPSGNATIMPLQPQLREVRDQWEVLAAKAHKINCMAKELEKEILEFKAIAGSVKNNSPTGQQEPSSKSWCKYFAISVPCVRLKSDKTFVMTTRKVDLYRLEREAASLAQNLREKSRVRDTHPLKKH
jgi:hypothetical protein